MTRQFRYAPAAFRDTVLAALLLTGVVVFFVWLTGGLIGFRNPGQIAMVSGLVFFVFCSAATLWRYMRRAVVFAVRQDGLYDARLGAEAVPWSEIKEVVVRRAENDFHLSVALWPDVAARRGQATIDVDLSSLDGTVDGVVEALKPHANLRGEWY